MIHANNSPRKQQKWIKLYINGYTMFSLQAIKNLDNYLQDFLKGYELEVIDITENSDEAERKNIIATPVLIREFPLPERRLVGNLADKESIILDLGLYTL
ncbi:MAG TPA: circadian clock KaiB family protein [Thermodesulfovibrionia bacterium]|nr:circadian clock KaiB family protein [Thermodesulfovibrionia bacterium]